MWMPIPTCRRLLRQAIRRALHLAEASAGRSMAARMAMMAITTSSSIRVKACRERVCKCGKSGRLFSKGGQGENAEWGFENTLNSIAVLPWREGEPFSTRGVRIEDSAVLVIKVALGRRVGVASDRWRNPLLLP